MNLDSNESLARARSVLGFLVYPQGRCLANVYKWFGSPASTGPGSGKFATALDAWNYAEDKRPGDWNAPAGVPVYFGVSETRTDSNKRAGDVGLSIGGGQGIFTDASGARVGVMTLRARAVQTQRPYLGWCGDFVGHPVTAAGSVPASSGATPIPEAPRPVPLPALPLKEPDMLVFAASPSNNWAAARPGYFEAIPAGQGDLFVKASGLPRQVVSDAEFAKIREVYLHMHPNQVYANTDTDTWYVVGPGVFFPIAGGKGGDYEALYGPRRAVNTSALAEIRKRHGV